MKQPAGDDADADRQASADDAAARQREPSASGSPDERASAPATPTTSATPAGATDRTLYLPNGPDNVGHLKVALSNGTTLEVEVSPSKLRVLLALREALNADIDDERVPESARGWRSPQQISDLIDARSRWQPFLRTRTVRSYVSDIHCDLQAEAARKGVLELPEIFERRPKKGIRLAHPLAVVDPTGTAYQAGKIYQ